MIFRLLVAACSVTLLLVSTGCDSSSPPLVPVTGRVVYHGVPLPTGTIVFTPDPQRGGTGQAARAEIEKDGTFRLKTGDLDGVSPGWHRITVLALEAPPGELPKNRFLIPRSLIPEKYRDPELSGLRREVKAGKDNQLDVELD